MSEFKLHHLVVELLEAFDSKGTPEEFVDYLQKHISASKVRSVSHTTIQNYIQHLAQISGSAKTVMCKYEDLKQKNVDSLGPYVQLLYQISQDSGVRSFLSKTSKRPALPVIQSTSEMTKDELPQVKSRLKKAVSERSPSTNVDQKYSSSASLKLRAHSVTSWVQRRPSMSWDFPSSMNVLSASVGTIGHVPSSSQENILIEDLLNILIGLPGSYIEPQDLKDPFAPRTFKISDAVDSSLAQLVKQILPVASNYSIVQRFTEQKMAFEYGQVNNALAEAMGTIITNYMLFITQLETEFHIGNLNLQKLLFYLQRNMQNMSIMSNISTTINKSDARGGKVLSLLHEYITGSIGDEKTEELCVHLMQCACVPYMKMLGMWIYKGIISDPIKEFLVEDNEIVQKEDMPVDYSADYWEKKYAIRRERIPVFLEPVCDIILRAGKYLNVIRQCGKPLVNKVNVIEYKVDEKHYIQAIEDAYTHASQTLLDLILKEKDLIGHLRSVKHYFLLDQGDFIVTFLTLCEKELVKNIADVVKGRLESLLDLALRLSSAVNDVYKVNLRTEMLPYDLQFQMFKILSIQTNQEEDFWSSRDVSTSSLIESFSFSYEVRWPLSLVLNCKSLACYQMIFRHLFYCKHVERMICQVWRSNKVAKKFPCSVANQYRTAFALRQRMLHCVQNLEYHMMVEVIEPHWCTFVQKISKVSNLDEVLTHHLDFVNACLKDCMLTIPTLLIIITKILKICVNFCQFIQNDAAFQTGCIPEQEQMESFEQSINRFNVEFTATLMQLLDQINDLNKDTSDHDRLFNLLYRFNFNSFYADQFESMGLIKLKNGFSG